MDVSKLFRHWTYQIFSPGTVLRERYEAFKRLLDHDRKGHELLAELEDIYYQEKKVDLQWIVRLFRELSEEVWGMITSLRAMAPVSYVNLADYYKKIDFYIKFILAPPEILFSPPFTLGFDQITDEESPLVGGKAGNFAVLGQKLRLPVPEGFVITTNAFNYFIECNNLRSVIDARLATLDISDTRALDATAAELVRLINTAPVPPVIENALHDAVEKLQRKAAGEVCLALRSSAVSEDSNLSFAGQYKTELGVTKKTLLAGYKQVLASKYSSRALYYRIHYGLSDVETPMAVLVLNMVAAKVSGVMTTVDPDGEESSVISIHAIWGLGELLVGGEVSPDVIRIKKLAEPEILEQRLGNKSFQMTATASGGQERRAVSQEKQQTRCLSEAEAVRLAQWGMAIEEFFRQPQDVEWCIDNAGRPFILQARPLQVEAKQEASGRQKVPAISLPVLLAAGDRAASGIGAGRVCRISGRAELDSVTPGAVLVAVNTLPSYVKVIDKLQAVVTAQGSRAGHFASVAREFGVPTLVNAGAGIDLLGHGTEVTVDADQGIVYAGIAPNLPSRKERRGQMAESPFRKKLKYLIDFISPLALVDPSAPSFVPESCRSFHDIIRFVHEKGMREMFFVSHKEGRRIRGAQRLVSEVPLALFVLNVGQGLTDASHDLEEIGLEQIQSLPMLAVWRGLTHPGIAWDRQAHFDWRSFDSVVMAGGVAHRDSAAFASYAVIDRHYMNLNMRFGYHFTIVDALCGARSEENYIMLRYAGGGGDFAGRALRTEFLAMILERLGFTVETKGDLLDAKFYRGDQEKVQEMLDMVGRLLGATKLMDMVLKDKAMVATCAGEFLQGRYNFSSAAVVGPTGSSKG